MSKGFVEKLFNEQFIRVSNKQMRKEIEAQPGQALILENLTEFNKVLKSLNIEELSVAESNSVLEKGRQEALRLHNDFKRKNKRRYNASLRKLDRIGIPLTEIGTELFIVSTFRGSLDAVKAVIVNEIQKVRNLSDTQRGDLSFMSHKGHGVRGFAVSQAEVAAGSNFIERVLKEQGIKNPQQFLANSFAAFAKGGTLVGPNEESIIQEIITNYKQMVTTRGKLRADYVSIVSYQYGHENSGRDAAFEQKVKRIFYDDFGPFIAKRIATMPGSSSLEQKALAHIIAQFKLTIKPGKNGTLVLKIENSYNPSTTKMKTSGVAKTKTKKAGKAKLVQAKTPVAPKVKPKPTASAVPDIRALIGLLNQRLPAQVAKNMESPALNYRTGRFASSVRVTDITSTTKGLPSIGFTYQKSPYQVFEYPGSGNSLAQNPFPGARDPRALIDKSIREIMAQFMVGRFYTRRQ